MSNLFGGGAKGAAKSPQRAMGITFQSSEYGRPVPVVYGKAKVGGNCIWYGDFKAIAHTQKQKAGKGGHSQSSTSYTYSASFQMGLCEGPISSVPTVYDGTTTTTPAALSAVVALGTKGQAAWSHLPAGQDIGYSLTATFSVQDLDLGSSASLPNYNYEVLALLPFNTAGGIVDANPKDILNDICTNAYHGVGFNYLGDLTAYSNYCVANGLFLSPVYDQQQTANQSLADLFKYTNSAPFFSEGVLKVVPYGDTSVTGNGATFTPNVTPLVDLGTSDFIANPGEPPVALNRKAPADAMNIVRVEFEDRANTYHTNVAIASIDYDVVANGARADQSETVSMCKQASVARFIAQNLVQRSFYVRNTYEFRLSWRYCYLEPMDIVTLTDPNTGLNLTPVRITEVSEDEDGLLSITAEEFPEGVGHSAIYTTQPNSGTTVDVNADPGAVNAPYLFRGPGYLVDNRQPEIWCAVSGSNALWGAADVYLSHDGSSYTYVGTVAAPARYGSLTTALPSGSDPDTTNTPQVTVYAPAQLLGGTQTDADNLDTLAMVGTELVSYQTASLVSTNTYQLGYLRRGAYGSAIASHSIGAPFVRLDDAIFRIPVDPSQIGKTIYIKFLSINAFGRTPRTLADETAYTYVIGTNVELPDVPPVPGSFAVTAVADGVSLTWQNTNPAAVGATSIEYATSAGGPWTVLAQVGSATEVYPHHFTDGATYYYRIRARGPLVQSGWSAYTGTISSTGKTVADGADNSAITVGPKILNPNFDAGDVYWVKETSWAITGGKGVRTGNAGAPNAAIYNSVLVPVKLAQQVMVQCVLTASGADGTCGAAVRWFDASQAYISQSRGNTVTGTAGNTLSRITAAAPANAAYASAAAVAVSNTTGTYTADSFQLTLFPNNQDEVPDSATRGATSTTYLNANRPVINFGDTFHQNKNLDNIGDGAVYGRPNLNRLNAGRPTIDFSETIHLGKNADNIADGTLYARLPVANSTGTGTSRRALIDFTQGHAGKIIDNLGDGTYARTLATRVNAGRPTVDFSETIHTNKTLDNIDNGGTYARTPFSTVPNLLKNPTGAMGLVYWGSLVSGNSTSTALGGVGEGYYFYAAPGLADLGNMCDNIACGANVALTLSVDMYTGGVTGGTVSVSLIFLDNTATEIAGSRRTLTATNGTGWTRYTGSYTSPAGTANVRVMMRATSLAGGNAGWRRLKLELGASATPYNDHGTQTGNRLAQAGSGEKSGDQRNLPASISQGYGGIRSATALTASSTGAVSVNAHNVTLGTAVINYNAQSNAITGLTQGTTYQIYTRDNYAGGSPPFYATTSAATANSFDDVYIAGQVTIPTSGSSGGGGGGYCVVASMWLRPGLMAGQARWWHWLDCFDGFRRRRGRVRGIPRITWAACVRIRTEHGAVLECASSTPFTVQDGRVVMAPALYGEYVLTDGGWERVDEVEGIGMLPVARIHVGGLSYAAGRNPSHRIFSHNPLKP